MGYEIVIAQSHNLLCMRFSTESSGVTGGGQGHFGPPQISDREIFADVAGKKRQGKRGENWEEKKENCKREGGKLEMEVGKVMKRGDDRKVMKRGEDLFFFLLFTFENDWNLFWVYQNGNFLPGKSISRRNKIRKNDFAPSEKYACYAPDRELNLLVVWGVSKI